MLTLIFLVSGVLSGFPGAMNTALAAEASDEADSGETKESETELQPVLLDTDKVSTDDFLLYSSSCVVMDVNTGAILYSKNRSDHHYPASTTKILTTLLALERTKLTDNVTFSREAIESISWDSSNMELKPGDELTMEQALYGIMLQSANEAAYGVAEYVSGSVQNFAEDMNDYAIRLGCRLSHFTNASGLHDDNHYTTAKDLATIARAAAQNDEFRKITGTIFYTVENIHYKVKEPDSDTDSDTDASSENSADNAEDSDSTKDSDEPVPEPFLLYNHHKMVNNEYPYEGCYGGKTGYTGEARNTLVTYAKRDDIDLVCVLLDCPGGNNYTYRDTQVALDYCFTNYERLTGEYNAAQELLDYPQMGLRDWYNPAQTPLTAEEGFYPYAKQSFAVYQQYLTNRKAREALDQAISEKDVHAFIEYSRLNNNRPLIIAIIVIFVVVVIFSLFLVHLAKVIKRKRSRRRYEKLRRQRLAENAKAGNSTADNGKMTAKPEPAANADDSAAGKPISEMDDTVADKSISEAGDTAAPKAADKTVAAGDSSAPEAADKTVAEKDEGNS